GSEEVASQQPATKFSKFLYNKIKAYDYHALIIGVDDYKHESVVDLDNPISDGEKLQKVLTERYRFSPDNITTLENPTRTEIIESFDNLSGEMTDQDNLVIFYAGHGIWDENLQQGYWLPSDAKADSKAAWLSNSTIRDYITGIRSKHTLLIADACFSGGIFKTRDVFVGETLGFANIFKLPSRKAITSGNLTPVQDISVFMKYFIKTLEENENPLLAAEELFSSVKIPVANNNMSGQVPQYGDILNAGDEGGDFVFILEQGDEDM
ncbi:MAG: caspase family protein, partial [Bacteroidota bacterium]